MKQDELEGSFSLPLPNSVLSTLLRLLLLTLLLHVLQSFGVNSSTFLINSSESIQGRGEGGGLGLWRTKENCEI